MRPLEYVLAAAIVIGGVSTSEARRYYGGGYGYGRAATAEQAADYGAAMVIRSQGMANLANAQAAVVGQQAYSEYLKNRLATTQTYFEMRQMNRQYRAQEAEKPATKEMMSRYAAQTSPKKLGPSELDPVTGQISWPLLLRDNEYGTERDSLQALLTLRAHHQDFNYSEVRRAADAMQTQLKTHINDLAPQDFENAHKFIDAVAFEAHYPAD